MSATGERAGDGVVRLLALLLMTGCATQEKLIDATTHPELFAGKHYTGEFFTSHRIGDITLYASACLTDGDAIAVAVRPREEREAFFMEMSRIGKCYTASFGEMAVPVQLTEWISGPYDSGRRQFSVWKGTDVVGDEVYVPVPDYTGEHEPAMEV